MAAAIVGYQPAANAMQAYLEPIVEARRTPLFRDHPASVLHVIKRADHRRPIRVALHELDVKTCTRSLRVADFPAVFLHVDLGDARAKHANPVIGPTVVYDVTNIEVPANEWALERVDVARRFERAEEKLVPHVLDGDDDAERFGERNHLRDLGDGALIRVGIGNLFRHHGGHEQHGAGAVGSGIAQALTQAFESRLAHTRIRIRERLHPVDRARDARDGESGRVARAQDFRLIHRGADLNAAETGVASQFEFLSDAQVVRGRAAKRIVHQPFFEVRSFPRGWGHGRLGSVFSCERERRRRPCGDCGGLKEIAADHARDWLK